MKLREITEGYWVIPPIDYPNSVIKNRNRKNRKNRNDRISFLTNPADRDNFFKTNKLKYE